MKKRLLWWGDGPPAATGFGTVSRYVLHALYATGEWDITVRGVNCWGSRHDYPYTIHPAGYPDGDPFGKRAFMRDLNTNPPFDLVIINNDTYVVNEMAGELARLAENGYPARTIFYFPVDHSIPPGMEALVNTVTMPVAYSRFGLEQIAKRTDRKVACIPHGCEPDVVRLTAQERRDLRRSAFHIADDSTFLWISVNRNSSRKDLARTIEAFATFRMYQPNAKLYVHAQAQDNGFDMQAAAAAVGVSEHVAFPGDFSLSAGGMPADMLRRAYQLADGFITTHLGEGWGLTVTEAMSCGLPVVAPRNSTMPEILGASYPFLYDCEDTVYVDNSGYRPRGTVRAIFGAMKRTHDLRGTPEMATILGKQDAFVRTCSWEAVGRMWVDLVNHTMTLPTHQKRLAEAV